jgi:hypothetical protein
MKTAYLTNNYRANRPSRKAVGNTENQSPRNPGVRVYSLDGKLIAVYGQANHWWAEEVRAKYYDENGRLGTMAEAELARWKYMAELVDLPRRTPLNEAEPQDSQIPYAIRLLWGIRNSDDLKVALSSHRCGQCEDCRKFGDTGSNCEDRKLLRAVAIEHGFKPAGVRARPKSLIRR